MSRYKAKTSLTTSIIEIASKMRFFGDETKEIKRVVKNDNIISLCVIEKNTENKFPFSVSAFKEIISKIKFD